MDTSGEVEFDKELTGTDDISPLSLPHLVMSRVGMDDNRKLEEEEDDNGMKPPLSDKLMVEPSIGPQGNYEPDKNVQVHVDTGVLKDPGMLAMTGRSKKDDMKTTQEEMEDIRMKQALS